jgi:outer membrane protein assembly factor BamB
MSNSIIAVQPRDSRKIFAYSTETGAWKGYALPEGVEASPILSSSQGGGLLALLMKGKSIPQVAAFDPSSGSWYAQDLSEPAQGKTQPIVAGNLAAYGLGRHVYAFSSDARRWDVLTLPEGSAPAIPVVHSAMVLVESGGKLYTFSAKTGRWTEFDTQTGE